MLSKIKIWLFIHYLKQWYGYRNISTELIYAQAYHETGNFTSSIFKENNNLFGMRQPTKRKNFATGSARGHATFASLFNSVRDYFERQKDFGISTGSDLQFMSSTVDSNYAEDGAYLQKWHNTKRDMKLPLAVKYSSKFIGLVVFLVLAYVIVKTLNNRENPASFKTAQRKFTNMHLANN